MSQETATPSRIHATGTAHSQFQQSRHRDTAEPAGFTGLSLARRRVGVFWVGIAHTGLRLFAARLVFHLHPYPHTPPGFGMNSRLVRFEPPDLRRPAIGPR